jgi:putative ABC transport system substrate-binding protein
MRRIIVFTAYSESDPEPKSWVTAFQQGLRSLGWHEGGNVRIDYRFAGTDPERIRAYAAEVVGVTPDVILAHSPPVVRALQQATPICRARSACCARPILRGAKPADLPCEGVLR